ncbi:MAG: hypothetical protein HKP06_03520 [Flavobacteriaceae bacterium]|nr:hypothetical protein [Flavobacteriaceae bacterium]
MIDLFSNSNHFTISEECVIMFNQDDKVAVGQKFSLAHSISHGSVLLCSTGLSDANGHL